MEPCGPRARCENRRRRVQRLRSRIPFSPALRLSIDACARGGHLRIVLLRLRDGQVHIFPVGSTLVVISTREGVVLGPIILTDQSPQVPKALTATERPECLLAE